MKGYLKLSVIIGAILLAGCVNQSGKEIDFNTVDSLTLGYTTQLDAKTRLGNPQNIKYDDGRTVYQYRYDNDYNKKQAVDLVFNKQQRLIDITIHDGIVE